MFGIFNRRNYILLIFLGLALLGLVDHKSWVYANPLDLSVLLYVYHKLFHIEFDRN